MRVDKAARIRWAVLLSALVATSAASLYSGADGTPLEVSAATARQSAVAAAVQAGMPPAPETDEEEGANPFAPHGWQAPPLPESMPPPVPLPVASVDLAPAGPPALPFRFAGGMSDGVEQVVYLARGEQTYVARVGEVLDTQYKVVAINPTEIEFEYTPTGTRQTLVFPARDN